MIFALVAASWLADVGGQLSPAQQQVQQVQDLSAVDVFDLADRARSAGRIDDAIAFYDALDRDENADVRAEARFRKGMMLADARRYEEAARSFRALLDEQPEAARVRIELARMLAALGDSGAARRELRQAQAGGLPPDVAATVGQFAQVLRSKKRFGGSVEVALAPDSNMNRATNARMLETIIAPLTLSKDARARSGLGVQGAGQIYARVPLSGSLSFVPRASGVGNIYKLSQFNDVSGSALMGLEWQSGQSRISPALGQSWRWYGGKLFATSSALALSLVRPLGSRAQLVATTGVSRTSYRRNGSQDGIIFDADLSIERAMSARTGISLSLSGTRQTARDPGYATASGGGTLLAWREAGSTTLFLSTGLRRTEGDEALFLFGKRRREWQFTARTGATFRGVKLGAFAPFGRLSYERNSSNVGLYDYHRVATQIGLTRPF